MGSKGFDEQWHEFQNSVPVERLKMSLAIFLAVSLVARRVPLDLET